MLKSRTFFDAALIGGSIVVAGGFQGHYALSACEQLSIRTGSDVEARRRQPLRSAAAERRCRGGLPPGGRALVAGGASAAAAGLRATEAWSGAADAWTQLPAELPVGEDALGFVKLGGDLACLAGRQRPKRSLPS